MYDYAAIVESLWEHAAENTNNKLSRVGLCPAAISGAEDIVTVLLNQSADVNERGIYGNTPLSLACGNGHLGVVKILLDTHQANINSTNSLGRTPLWYATRYGYAEVCQALRNHARASTTSLDDENLPEQVAPRPWTEQDSYCDVCSLSLLSEEKEVNCRKCMSGLFVMCLDCYEAGARCIESSHILEPDDRSRQVSVDTPNYLGSNDT